MYVVGFNFYGHSEPACTRFRLSDSGQSDLKCTINIILANIDLYGTTQQLTIQQHNRETRARTWFIAQNNASDWYHLSVIIFELENN